MCYRPRVSTENPPDPAATSRPQVSASAIAALLGELRAALGPQRVSTRTEDRATYSRDMWTRGLLAIAAGQPPGQTPSVIVWPETAAEVQTIVRLARRHQVPLVPFGAGSGVTGAVVPVEGGLVLDMKRMRALCIDAEQMTITCEPGLLGSHLEERLNRHGLTLGHFPSSIMCSTVGGWLATRGAGQMSTKYGKIEDLVQGIEVVTGSRRAAAPRQRRAWRSRSHAAVRRQRRHAGHDHPGALRSAPGPGGAAAPRLLVSRRGQRLSGDPPGDAARPAARGGAPVRRARYDDGRRRSPRRPQPQALTRSGR